MPDGNDCPECGENIGMWAVFKAPLPNRIYCPHCTTRLRYGDTTGPIALAVVLTIVLVAASVGVFFAVGLDEPVLAAVVAFLVFAVGGILLEVLFVSTLWNGTYRLEHVNRPAMYEDEEF